MSLSLYRSPPCRRGPRGDGTCLKQNVLIRWDPAQAIWKTELPGIGHASPIIWGDYVLTVTALPATQERVLLCLDRHTGTILWRRMVVQGPLQEDSRVEQLPLPRLPLPRLTSRGHVAPNGSYQDAI